LFRQKRGDTDTLKGLRVKSIKDISTDEDALKSDLKDYKDTAMVSLKQSRNQ
jgi:hypothetical protein